MEGNSPGNLEDRKEWDEPSPYYGCPVGSDEGLFEAGSGQEGPEGDPHQNPYFWILLLMGLFFFLLAIAGPARAHGNLAKACPVLKGEHAPIFRGEKVAENGLIEEAYDRGGAAEPDMWTYSTVLGTELEAGEPIYRHQWPLFYVVDEGYDGSEDKVYVDRYGNGKCEDIHLYYDNTINHDRENDLRPTTESIKEQR